MQTLFLVTSLFTRGVFLTSSHTPVATPFCLLMLWLWNALGSPDISCSQLPWGFCPTDADWNDFPSSLPRNFSHSLGMARVLPAWESFSPCLLPFPPHPPSPWAVLVASPPSSKALGVYHCHLNLEGPLLPWKTASSLAWAKGCISISSGSRNNRKTIYRRSGLNERVEEKQQQH